MPHHLRGNQWRESPRAVFKKNQAKAKHFGSQTSGGAEEVAYSQHAGAQEAFVIGSALGRVSIFAGGSIQQAVNVSPDAPRQLAKTVVPGDIVTVTESDGNLSVTGILERRNVLSRMRRDSTRRSYAGAHEQVIAANIDTAAIVVSAQSPPLHPKFIDRYLILLEHNGIAPIVCLNKGDLATQEERHVLETYRQLGITAVETSTVNDEGIDALETLLRGKIAILVGQSGVGKSSLINSLDPTAGYRTGEVSDRSGKGRHTTTTSVLHQWDDDSYIIDTPGIRSLEVWDVDPQELQYYYTEFEPYIPNCRYSDCLHVREPLGRCAVQRAVGDGISPGRYESYVKILNEL